MKIINADKFKENILSGLYIFCQENKEDIARAIDDEPALSVHDIILSSSYAVGNQGYAFCPYCGKDLRKGV